MKIFEIFRSGSHSSLSAETKKALQKFNSDELHVLKKTFEDLSERSGGKGVDKETFLQFFPLNGLLGERLFAQFDTRKTGVIDFEGFITGLATVCRGTLDDKMHFLFNMYDVSHDNTVSKQELSTLLNHIPKEALSHDYPPPGTLTRQSSSGLQRVESDSEKGSVSGDHTLEAGSAGSSAAHPSELEDLDFYTNQDVVEKAFAECDLNHEGRLTYEEFKMWVQRNPSVMEYIESILPYNGPKDTLPHTDKKETLPHMRRIHSRHAMGRANTVQEAAGEIFNHSTGLGNRRMSRARLQSLNLGTMDGGGSPMPISPSFNLSRNSSFSHAPPSAALTPSVRVSHSPSITEHYSEGEEQARQCLIQAMEATQNPELKASILTLLESMPETGHVVVDRIDTEIYRTVVSMESYLWKKGKSVFHILSRRYYLLAGNCVYYYAHKNDVRVKGVVFVTGSIIERKKDDEMEARGYYGFEIVHQDLCTGEHHRHDKRILYCKSEEECERWVSTLQHAAHVVPIEDDYVIGKELGRGRFSVVCECVHKVTGVHCAVKIIDKSTIEPAEKSLLRTEIAVLKLVNHPNIIRMEGLYESKQYIYIVMEMLKGGELFERIVGRPRFTETEAAKLMRPLLESVAYLHDLGIVHRDLKPENILCGDELDDLKIADFGLSKMVLPKEKMDAACGTLSYVAPEVLTMQGYGKEADLWSVGVILFLLLCGKLPFDGEDHNEIIRSTIQADLKVNPTVWSKLSEDAKNIITALLNKNPKDRITAREALKHPFLVNNLAAQRKMTISVPERLSGGHPAIAGIAENSSLRTPDYDRSPPPHSGSNSPM